MGLFRAFRRFLDVDHRDPRAVALYRATVDQARQPEFYTVFKVKDSVDGRWDMIVLHIFLVLNRFPLPDRQHTVLRCLLEELFADMDNSLREIGVGDLSVPKKIHRMVDALYGRLEAYEKALDEDADGAALVEVLERNVYRGEADHGAAGLAAYVAAARAHLAGQGADAILNGALSFPAPADTEETGNE